MTFPDFTAEASLSVKRRDDAAGNEIRDFGRAKDRVIPAGCLENEYDVCRSQGGGRFECAFGAVEECGRRALR